MTLPLPAALRVAAKGLYTLEAATGLIIAHGTWQPVRRASGPPSASGSPSRTARNWPPSTGSGPFGPAERPMGYLSLPGPGATTRTEPRAGWRRPGSSWLAPAQGQEAQEEPGELRVPTPDPGIEAGACSGAACPARQRRAVATASCSEVVGRPMSWRRSPLSTYRSPRARPRSASAIVAAVCSGSPAPASSWVYSATGRSR